MNEFIKLSPKRNAEITILLSIFNGAAYLREQLNSIVEQTYKDWILLVRDDGSEDNSVSIIYDYQAMYPDRIIIVPTTTRLGASLSFGSLLEVVDSPYVMLCDQDDVWMRDKIDVTLEAMKTAECEYPSQPILVHSDLIVTDSKLQPINRSFWNFQNINQNAARMNQFLIQNHVTGCTMMLNRKLVAASVPIPQEAMMHDWWIALTCAAFGKIVVVNKATMMYRQHDKNVVGAKSYAWGSYWKRLDKIKESETANLSIIRQAEAFKRRHLDALSQPNYDALNAFCQLLQTSRFTRVSRLLRFRILKHGFVRNVFLFS